MNRFMADNLERVKVQIAQAARHAGRDPGSVRLVAVSKGIPVHVMRAAQVAGITTFGENRVQEFIRKYREFGPEVEWHFIGYLQRNKVRNLVNKVKLIHSLDRWNLATELNRQATQEGVCFDALVQINVARERSKHGLYEEELRDFLTASTQLPGVRIRGLMTMAPFVHDPEEVRPVFRRLRELAEDNRNTPGLAMDFLSMGMTQDYMVAVEEGANIVRVGTAIFNPLQEGKGKGHG
ncbi:MAG: YggS family pyridoxal phosphate-dependent enzyme [Bacillota bacterium]